jgi:hypothetical protein
VNETGQGTFSQPGGRLRSQYARLRPEERFRAVLEAGARGDDREREALVASAPLRTYRLSDGAYLDRVDASRDLALAVAVDLGPRVARLRCLELLCELLADVMAAAAEADAVAVPPWPLLDELRRGAAAERSQVAAVLEAFRAVCHDELALST